ncbi:MAG TPA: hypothetical protein PKA41_04115 [Verrucomicrobiota bacterium]|nr:hypothetical protein [Verrucomicrobiota bacterium]
MNPPRSIKAFVWIVAVSVTANVLMAGLWLKQRMDRQPADGTTEIVDPTTERQTAATSKSRRKVSGLSAPLGNSPTTAAIASWNDVQADDLKEWIRRLREAGCPEETIQDIIVAEVNRRYSARTRELWPDRYENKPFWQVQSRDREEIKRNRVAWRRERELQKEKTALLVDLFGFDPEKRRRMEEGFDEPTHWMDQRVSFLPEEKREAVLQYLEDFEERMQEFYSANRGVWDAQYRAERKQLEAEQLAGLSQFLSPAELREFELRQSQTAQQMGWELRGLTLTREEYEALFDTRKKFGDSIYNYGDIEGSEAIAQVEANKKAMQAEIVAALGETKGKEYERSQDHSYQELTRIAKKFELPVGTAAKVYDFKETAEESVRQLQNDQNLTREQRSEALQQIKTETEKAVQDALGETAFKRYQRQGGWWLNNLAPQPARSIPGA